eukprot:jgi/Picsp_1/1858/NSC_05325-R1_homeobox prox 1
MASKHAAIQRYLKALQYPGLDEMSEGIDSNMIYDDEWVRRLVVWLEDTKIRYLAVEDRKGLKSTDSKVWKDAIRRYVRELKCPFSDLDTTGNSMLVENALVWVLGYAVDLAYEDGAEKSYDRELAQVLEEAQHFDPRHGGGGSQVFEDLDAPETIAAFNKLCEILVVENKSREMSVEALKACVSRLEDDMLPIVQHAPSDVLGFLDDPKALEEAIPIGFITGDAVVDKAARVLRVLYAKDFRRLQNAIDDAIVKQQEITANPRTETARGKTRKSR